LVLNTGQKGTKYVGTAVVSIQLGCVRDTGQTDGEMNECLLEMAAE